MVCNSHIYEVDEITEGKRDWACSMHENEEQCIRHFCGKM